MAVSQETTSDQLVDSAIGPIRVTISSVEGFDVDDYVTSTIQSMAIAIKMFNVASKVNTDFTTNRRKVSVGGVTVGGY